MSIEHCPHFKICISIVGAPDTIEPADLWFGLHSCPLTSSRRGVWRISPLEGWRSWRLINIHPSTPQTYSLLTYIHCVHGETISCGFYLKYRYLKKIIYLSINELGTDLNKNNKWPLSLNLFFVLIYPVERSNWIKLGMT